MASSHHPWNLAAEPKSLLFTARTGSPHDFCSHIDMLDRDFFRFCTSLKPLELKAIGQLSRVKHLAESETVYAPGDPADALYIINRGVIEVIQADAQEGSVGGYLTRGDIFGDVELMAGLCRKQLVRTREPVSVQCFARKDFPELARRVPRFFQYLSQHLAYRLLQASDFALAQSQCLELSGSLANFDLVTIYQTIVHSSQTGELRITSESSELISTFFFERGQPRYAQFQHLTGEDAFWQLFSSEKLSGKFSFTSSDEPSSTCIQSERLNRDASDMLITALQGRDELIELQQRMPEGLARVYRRKADLSWPSSAPSHLREIARQIWGLTNQAPIPVSVLFHGCSACHLNIYRALEELVSSQHLAFSEAVTYQKVA